MDGSRRRLYWDSCIFLSWLLEDQPEDQMNSIREYIVQIENRKLGLVTSTLIEMEVLGSTLAEDVKKALERFLKRSNVHVVSPGPRIMQLGGELRDHYKREKDAGRANRMLSTPDAIHLATAIQYHVDEFHTFDGGSKSKHLGLLGLSGNVAGHRLTICKPQPRQRRMTGF